MRWVGAAALAALLAQDQIPQEQIERERARAKFDPQYRKVVARLAEDHVRLGGYLDGARLHAWAVAQYKRALELDPDNAKARKRLGFSQEGAEWVPDPAAKIKDRNERESGLEKYQAELDARQKEVAAEAVKGFERLGNLCQTLSLPEEEKACWKMLLQYDPAHSKALDRLGHEAEGDRWVSPEEKAAREWFREGLAPRSPGEAVEETSPVAERLGLRTRRRRSERFEVESTHVSDPTLQEIVRLVEQTWDRYHALFGLAEPLVERRIWIVLFKTQEEHASFIEAYEPGTPAEKNQSKQNEGAMYTDPPTAECVQRNRPREFLLDYPIHSTCHLLQAFHTGAHRAWLLEGLATYFTLRIQSTALSACVNLEGTSQEGGKAFNDPEQWPLIVRDWMRKGGDPPMRAVLRSSLNELDRTRMIKAWSLVDFLVLEHRDRMGPLARALAGDERDPGEKAFREILGLDADALDAAWKEFARRAY